MAFHRHQSTQSWQTWISSQGVCDNRVNLPHRQPSLFWISTCPVYLIWLMLIMVVTGQFGSADENSGFYVRAFAFKNAQIVPRPGQLIEVGTILVRDGRVTAIGRDVEIPQDAEVIDASGLVIYPGLIDAGVTAFFEDSRPAPLEGRHVEISKYALAGSRSDDHSGLTPEYSIAKNVKLTSNDRDSYRKEGFVAVHLLPSGRIASGQGAIVNLASLPPRESILVAPSFVTFQFLERDKGEYPGSKMGSIAHLRQTFLDAELHARQKQLFDEQIAGINRPPSDAVFDTLMMVRSSQLKPLFLASAKDEQERVLNFAAEHRMKAVIWGGDEAYRLTDRLAKTETDLILHVDFGDEPKMESPKNEDPYPNLPEPKTVFDHRVAEWKRRIAGLADLSRANIRFAVSSRDGRSPGDLLKAIRLAIANGLHRDAALAALTTQAAAILNVERDLGGITVGAPAYFIAMTGPFDHEQSKVRYSVIAGHQYEYNKDAKLVQPVKSGGQPSANLTGAWSIEIESAAGKLRGEMELAQNDQSLSGRFHSAHGDGRVSSGRVTKEGVEFVVSIGAGESTINLNFQSSWKGDPPDSVSSEESDSPPKNAVAEVKPIEMQGRLKSPFGAVTNWIARRQDPKPNPASSVELGSIETAESDSVGKSVIEAAVSALTPANSKEGLKLDQLNLIPFEQPVEFPEDRRLRRVITGGNVLIQNGTVLTARGQTLNKTSVLIKGGSITAIGPDLQPEPGMLVIDASGRYLMPGIIDTHSHIMIANGINEATSSIVCEVRVRDVIDTADSSEYRALAGGVTTARLLHGSANCIGGQDAVIQLKHGTSASEHLFPGAHSGVKFALGENVKYRGGRFPNTRLGVEATLNRAFLEALDYRRQWIQYEQARQQAGGASEKMLPPRRDLRLETLADILEHRKFIHSHCYRADEILMLLRVAENHGVRVWSLQHVLEGYKVAPEIVRHGASCSTFADWWAYKVEAFDATPYNAALLHEAGANTVIKSDDWELIRHLYQEAAKTVRYGNMPPDAALQTITLNSANELGLSDRIGSIEVGKQADIAIFSGHPLNAFSRCEQTFIAGELYFNRERQPSIMTNQVAAASGRPAELKLLKPEERITRIELDASAKSTFAIVGATLHPIDQEDISNGVIIVEDGRFKSVGQQDSLPADIPVINATGLHVYPGLIDAGTSVGLIEIGMVRATSDLSEIGQFQSDLRAGVGVNPDSELIPVARAGGITTTLCLPAGGANMTSHDRSGGATIAGQASLLQLAGWTMPDVVMEMEAGLHLLWPRGTNRKTAIEDLKRHWNEARIYDQARQSEALSSLKTPSAKSNLVIDPRYESLRPYLRGEKSVFIEADTRQEIVEALQFAEQEKLKIVLCGVTDGWKVSDRIKAARVPLILGPVMRKPIENYDPFDAPYANAGRLHEAGIRFGFRSDTASNSRNLPFEAAMAVAYGLPENVALRAVTLTNAEILGVAGQLGSLSVGKRANAVITDGSPLQPTSQIKGVLINGKGYPPESRQTRFYEKYRARLKN